MAKRCTFRLDDTEVQATPGDSLASTLMNLEVERFHAPKDAPPQQPFCGMGHCMECRVTVDGIPHQRSCLITVRDGMQVETGPAAPPAARPPKHGEVTPVRSADIVVVGAGPAGLRAAVVAAETKQRVVVIDQAPAPGGNIWKATASVLHPKALAAIERAHALGVQMWHRSVVIAPLLPDGLLVETPEGPVQLRYRRLVLATGAWERVLPFPGWMLPGVVSAGGAQVLSKGGWDLRDRRVVLAGEGPLLFEVAHHLASRGAKVSAVATARAPALRPLTILRMLRAPGGYRRRAFELWRATRRAVLPSPSYVVEALGDEGVQAVRIQTPKGEETLPCDVLALSDGLLPETTLARHLGVALNDSEIAVDGHQQTNQPNVFAAGDATGVQGVLISEIEGRIAGHVAATGTSPPPSWIRKKEQLSGFARNLMDLFEPNCDIDRTPPETTVICRCERVRFSDCKSFADARSLKLQTRCGMGPCQGRLCEAGISAYLGHDSQSWRPPIHPAIMATLSTPSDLRESL